MTLTRTNPFELLVDSRHGQYTGQIFAETIKRELFPTISAEDWAALESGPDHESYNDVCAELDQHSTEDGISLWWSEGDLWAVDWSLIGDPEEIEELAERAEELISADSELSDQISELFANLRFGPDSGRWSAELLADTKDRIRAICDQIESSAPIYWSSWCGIEERRVDIESMLIARSGGAIKELAAYW
jgi:hypothetical protein